MVASFTMCGSLVCRARWSVKWDSGIHGMAAEFSLSGGVGKHVGLLRSTVALTTLWS